MKKDWQLTRFGKLLTPMSRPAKVDPTELYRILGMRWYAQGLFIKDIKLGQEIRAQEIYRVESGDFVYNRLFAWKGSFGIVDTETSGGYVSGEFPCFIVDTEQAEPKFLHQYLAQEKIWQTIADNSTGQTNVSRLRLKEQDFLKMEIPLPPLPEQQRIVARIEELARRVEEARGLRREANAHTDLLFYSHAQQLRAKLMNEYKSRAIGEITTVTSGGTPDRQNPLYWQDGTIAWIKTGELLDGEIWDSEEKITNDGMKNSSARMFPVNTVLIALYGQGQTRGRTGLLRIPATTNQACAAIFPQPELFDSRYMQVWLQSLYHEMRANNHGGAQPNWNGGMIKQIKIALPALDEQRRIVAYLDGLNQKVDELRRLQAATQKELDALMPSILAKAFSGEL